MPVASSWPMGSDNCPGINDQLHLEAAFGYGHPLANQGQRVGASPKTRRSKKGPLQAHQQALKAQCKI